jgi:flavodoxin
MKILILYYTKTGHTLEAADATAEGIRSAGSEVDLVPAQEFDAAKITDYEALIVANPCWAGSAGRMLLPKPVERALASMGTDDLAGKRCGGISVHSGIGGEVTVEHIGEILKGKGCTDYRQGPVARAGVPFSLWKGPSVQPEDEARYAAFGAAFVERDARDQFSTS